MKAKHGSNDGNTGVTEVYDGPCKDSNTDIAEHVCKDGTSDTAEHACKYGTSDIAEHVCKEGNTDIAEVYDRTCKEGNAGIAEVYDGPWSIAVGISSFLAQCIIGGYVYTGGIYYTLFIEEFHDMGPVTVNWMCNMPSALWFLGSPIGSLLTNSYGPRVCSIVGGSLAGIGLAMCFLSNSFYILFLGYGIIAGFGHGITFVGFITAVSRYFQKYRALVAILASLGPMVGMALYSFLIPYLIDRVHWRGSLLILGGLAFNICACAMILFPVNYKTSTRKTTFVSVLKIRNLVLFSISVIFLALAAALQVLHLPSLVISCGLGSNMASLTLTVFAIANSAAKIICSGVGQFVPADPINVYNGFMVVYSVAMIVLPAMCTRAWVLLVDIVMAFGFNVCGGHTMETVFSLTGSEQFSNGVGLMMLCKSFGMLVAGPFAGLLFELTGEYQMTFYVSGCINLVGCAVLLPVMVQRCRGVKPAIDANPTRNTGGR